ncbi:SHPS1 phosphatase, partial [Urocolius indicus]|nr:SHPS1 phosphatase [Urocolius indicus]
GALADQGFELQQPQDKVSVAAGETLSLTCTVSGQHLIGPVRWLKGWGSDNETIYEPGVSFPRVTRTANGSNTDFSIHIRDVHPGDSGTYYCVKFRRSFEGEVMFQHGKGTEVAVTEPSLLPSMAAAAGLLCFLLLLGLLVALCTYRRKRRGGAEGQGLAGLAATGSFSPLPLRCCAGTPSTPRFLLGIIIQHSCALLQQGSKEDSDIHYADLQPLPVGAWPGPSPSSGCSEYASVRVAAQ